MTSPNFNNPSYLDRLIILIAIPCLLCDIRTAPPLTLNTFKNPRADDKTTTMPAFSFEVLLPVQHRGSLDMADKLIGKAKKGEVLTGDVISNNEDEWLRLDSMTDVFVPLRAQGKQILKPLSKNSNYSLMVAGGMTAGGSAAVSSLEVVGNQKNSAVGPGDELEGLHALGDAKFGIGRKSNRVGASGSSSSSSTGSTGRGGGPRGGQTNGARGTDRVSTGFHSAATSHERHNMYMQEMEQGLHEMGIDTRNDPYLHPQRVQDNTLGLGVAGRKQIKPVVLKMNNTPQNMDLHQAAGGDLPELLVDNQNGGSSSSTDTRQTSIICGSSAVGASTKLESALQSNWQSVKHGEERQNWAVGQWVDVSDRNILCMATAAASSFGAKKGLASSPVASSSYRLVVGGADHQLKELEVGSGKVLRSLYHERLGHRDWVAACCYCATPVDPLAVVSGGADAKLCVWEKRGCKEMTGHTGSISKLEPVRVAAMKVVSSSYDKTLRIWDLKSKRECVTLIGHTAPVLHLVQSLEGSLLLSGDRSGLCRLWDTTSGQCLSTLKGHQGHITAMATTSGRGGLFFTGAQDGHVRAWDPRQRVCAQNIALHTGAVNDILPFGDTTLVTVGADNTMKWTDLSPTSTAGAQLPTTSSSSTTFHKVGNVSDADFVYAAKLFNQNLIVLGDGHGFLSGYDPMTGEERWARQRVTQNAIRCIDLLGKTLAIAGDDGNVQFLQMQ
ncbi:unnamed protein product [Amoebophrya sp. A25]|nr:unnamed protein product [Amoebophrya sp. A25]|eukprot:GSA25T00005986001.1